MTLRLRRMVASLAAGALLSTVAPSVAAAAPATTVSATTAATSTCSNQYLDGDKRLGPEQLPNTGEVAEIVRGYHPLAGLTAQQFIDTYWDPTTGGWRYPPQNGYLIAAGRPVEYKIPLGVGQNVDRFGSEFGAFLAPEGTPYYQRALPPMSLDNFDINFTCNYHEYRVIKSFLVESGPIAPGFGQRGMGRQYQLDSALVPGAPARLTVKWLIDNGYLQRID